MTPSKLYLNPRPTLADLQEYIKMMVEERGFEEESVEQTFLLFMEECGEMAKAARKSRGFRIGQHSQQFELDSEIADVFIHLLKICHHFDIDLEQAFRDKEEVNKKRNWE